MATQQLEATGIGLWAVQVVTEVKVPDGNIDEQEVVNVLTRDPMVAINVGTKVARQRAQEKHKRNKSCVIGDSLVVQVQLGIGGQYIYDGELYAGGFDESA